MTERNGEPRRLPRSVRLGALTCAIVRGATSVALIVAAGQGVQAQGTRLAIGTLSCSAPAHQSYVVGSTHPVDCVFATIDNRTERYVGEIRRVGVDIGFSNGTTLVWAVTASTDRAPDSLVGTYAGPSIGVVPGVGLGANALVGGSERSISLQPFSVELKTGVALSGGIATLSLRRP